MGLVLPDRNACRMVFNRRAACWEVRQGMIIVCRGDSEKCQHYINIHNLKVRSLA